MGVSAKGGGLILVALKDKRGILSHILTLVPSDWNIRRSTRDQRMGKGTFNRIHGKGTIRWVHSVEMEQKNHEVGIARTHSILRNVTH